MDTTTRAARYVASLRPAMRPEAERIAREHLVNGECVADCAAILGALEVGPMDTAALTISTDDTVTLPAVDGGGRHRRPSLLARVRYYTAPEPVPTAVILLGVLLMVAGVVAAAVWPAPVSPGAVWDPTPVAVAPVATVQCDSDASCAAYDYARGVQPDPVWSDRVDDDGGGYVCPAGWALHDFSAGGSGSHDGRDGVEWLECLPSGYVDGQRWT